MRSNMEFKLNPSHRATDPIIRNNMLALWHQHAAPVSMFFLPFARTNSWWIIWCCSTNLKCCVWLYPWQVVCIKRLNFRSCHIKQNLSIYKTNCIILGLNCETNLMRYINSWLADGHCSITVASYGLIWLFRFVSRISTHLCKKFYKQILFDISRW